MAERPQKISLSIPLRINLAKNITQWEIHMCNSERKFHARLGRPLQAPWALLALAILTSPPLVAKERSKYWAGAYSKFTEIAGAERVGSETCVSCHAEVSKNFRHAFHAQQGVECEDCHGAGSLHVKGNGDVTKIVNFRSRTAEQADGVCLNCHAQNEKVRHWIAGAHATSHVKCIECHLTHTQSAPSLTASHMNFDTMAPGHVTFVKNIVPESSVRMERRSALNDTCLKCHQTERAQTYLPYHHPLREGKITCVDCHDPHGGAAGNNLTMANANQLCLSCHAQYRGPFMYQHPPVTENCMICHSPHGSPNSNLLTVSLPALCLQCHTGHHDGAGLPLVDRCTNCHGSIHGTDVPTPTGGSRFVDKGGLGVPGFPQPSIARGLNRLPVRGASALVAAHAAMRPSGNLSMAASHPSFKFRPMVPFAGAAAGMLGAFPGGISAGMGMPPDAPMAQSYGGFYFTPGAYRFLSLSGYGGRVGQYDSLQESVGGDLEADYVSIPHHVTFLTRGTVLSGSDFDIKSRLTLGDLLEVGGDLRSFVEQQDNYPFYSEAISPDITTASGTQSIYDQIAPGTVFGVKRRLGNAYARLKVPNSPVQLFVKGGWQARVGHTQFMFLDENTNTNCGETCHYTSQLQRLNYTTRNVGGGVEVKTHSVNLTYEHDYSSFNDRLPFPSGSFGPMLNEFEPNPNPVIAATVADTPPGMYYLDIPAPSTYSADTASLNWTPSTELIFNGQASYRRGRDVFTNNPQNAFDADTMLSWHPEERLRLTADYRQQNLVNNFTPYFAYYGNMSYHEYWAGLKADYEITNHLNWETKFEHSGITRSNAFLWPQVYSFSNTDQLYVVPDSSRNTIGIALHYHPQSHLNARGGYEWTGNHNPGYLIDAKVNHRVFADVTLTPAPWLTFTNDLSIILQNAFPVIHRQNRFYVETASATLAPVPFWNLVMGYSYQQNNLATYMAFNNDAAAGYVVDEPFVPYHQLTQSYWIQSAFKYKDRAGLNVSLAHSSAHSGMLPDVNPNDYLLLGNGPGIQDGTFDPSVFAQALQAIQFGSAQASQVNVPQFIGQGKVYYLLPHGFDSGFLISYGSYRDYTNPYLNGILRSYSLYFGRSW
jgi:predicted CXXCH cytochrome family protein